MAAQAGLSFQAIGGSQTGPYHLRGGQRRQLVSISLRQVGASAMEATGCSQSKGVAALGEAIRVRSMKGGLSQRGLVCKGEGSGKTMSSLSDWFFPATTNFDQYKSG